MDNFWLLLIVLGGIGGITYFAIRYSAAGLTRTPVWALWLVMMLPALTWAIWSTAIAEEGETMPGWLLLGSFLICSFLYLWLLQRGRRDEPKVGNDDGSGNASDRSVDGGRRGSETLAGSNPAQPLAVQKPQPLLTDEEESSLRGCFPWNTYYLQQIEYGLQTIACWGKLRADSATAYERVRENIEERFGARFLVVLQDRPQGGPYFMLYPNPGTQPAPADNSRQPTLALLLLGITFVTTIYAGALLAGESPEALQEDMALLRKGVSYAAAIVFVLGLHGLGHFFASVYHRIQTSWPLLIPIPVQFFPLGTLGVFYHRRSPVPNRRALFDTSVAGPLLGLLASLPILSWGLSISGVVPLGEWEGLENVPPASLFNLRAFDPRGSLLLTLMCKFALGGQFVAESVLELSPLAIAGFVGAAIAALKLLPVSRLEGGRIVHAMYGRYAAGLIGNVTRVLVFLRAFSERGLLIWAIVLFILPTFDDPALDDVTELNGWRDALGLFVLALVVAIFLPAPRLLLGWLQI